MAREPSTSGSFESSWPVRMSQRPPPRFSGDADLKLWLTRFEMYAEQAKLPRDQWTKELLPLLDDGPLRVVAQQGLTKSEEYQAVVRCLKAQYAPEGNQLEWQMKFQRRAQKSGETTIEFVGVLRELADKAYPQWSGAQRLELVKGQFIQGLRCSSAQFKLMREMPETLDDALKLAIQQESVEEAQRRMSKENVRDSAAVAESVGQSEEVDVLAKDAVESSTLQRLSRQVRESERVIQQLRRQLQELSGRPTAYQEDAKVRTIDQRPSSSVAGPRRLEGAVCWNCGERGHFRRSCPTKRKERRSPAQTSAVSSMLLVEGQIEGQPLKMLVDTGSAVTLVREDVLKGTQLKPILTLPANGVVAANGSRLDISGQCVLKIRIGSLLEEHAVLIARSLNQQCILGADFLTKQGCVVDLNRQVLFTKVGPIQFVSSLSAGNDDRAPEAVCFVHVTESVTIPPSCQMRLPVNIGPLRCDCSTALIEPMDGFMDRHGLLLAHSLVDASAQRTMVQVLNPCFAPVAVAKGERIGMLTPVNVCASVQCQAGKRSQQAIRHTIEQMTLSMECGVRERVVDLLWKYNDVISLGDSDLGRTRLLYHKINTGDAQPVRQAPRRLPFHRQAEVRGLIDGMLVQGVIEPSNGPWASPIVLVKKKDGSTRFCVDFRRVNVCTRKDAQPLPRIDDTLDALGGACYFSTLDLASGYWQVEVDVDDREKTAFTTPFGLYQFRVMPFGLCNAPATFQRLMERVLAGLHWSTCLVYLDDIIVFSKTAEQHLKQLEEVFDRLRNAGLKLRPAKCRLLQNSVHYLGHVISADGIRTDPEKIASVANWPIPDSVKDLQSFLGLATYYRRFVKDFAQLASPLHALTQKGRQWAWTEDCNNAFFELKKKLVSSPVLALPDFSLAFVLDTDASGDGVGAVLSQGVGGKERVVAYASRALSRTEKKYCATRREMLAVVWASRHFRPYLYGRKFTLRTDHNSLKWLHRFKDPEGQVARWLEVLAEFDYTVVHREGKRHTNADALSRSRCKQCGLEQTDEDCDSWNCSEISNPLLPAWTVEEIKDFQRNDPDLVQVLGWLQSATTPPECPKDASWRLASLWTQRGYLTLNNGILYRHWEDVPGGGVNKHLQLVLPRKLVNDVLDGLHGGVGGGHLGVRKTLDKIRARFYWPGQRKDVDKWCGNCTVCSSRKSPSPKARAPLELSLVERPMQRVAMDILGPLPETPRGNKYILVVGDYFTKWKEAYPLRDTEALTIARVFVNEFVCRFGVPDCLHTETRGRTLKPG